jgi:hypothetical protein
MDSMDCLLAVRTLSRSHGFQLFLTTRVVCTITPMSTFAQNNGKKPSIFKFVKAPSNAQEVLL